jgi:hypothetical protein
MELANNSSPAAPKDFLHAIAAEARPKELKANHRMVCADCEDDIAAPRFTNDTYLALCPRCQQRHYLAEFIPQEM